MLTKADLAKLADSGIQEELAAQAKLYRVDAPTGAALVGRPPSGDYEGIVFPNFWPGDLQAREYRLRLDRPPLEYKDGKPRETGKYLSPPGRGNLLYLVPGTEAAWLLDPSIPIVITEGEKKALALWAIAWDGLSESAEAPSFVPVGVAGVWAWRGVTGKTNGPDGERRDVKGLIPDVNRILWKDRKVTILYDTNVDTNSSVEAARRSLTTELQRMGAKVFWFCWPPGPETPKGINGVDDLVGMVGPGPVGRLITTRSMPVKITRDEATATRKFEVLDEAHYRLTIPAFGVSLDLDRCRCEHHELHGELWVRCELPGSKTVVDHTLSIAEFNLSSARASAERAKLLAERAQAKELDWAGILEELRIRVLQADRQGSPGVYLHTIPKSDSNDDTISVSGLCLPKRHPSILFGDGGAVKSYLGLYFVGSLARDGVRVALFDWELAGEDHRDRLERLFGKDMPEILYVRCERPLVHELDRLKRLVREKQIEYMVYDSVAYACYGPPESAEAAGEYFRAVRQIGRGSLHVAHINKSETADQKPFGSIFWHNSARSTWYAERAEESQDGSLIRLGLFNRKANLGPLRPPLGFTVAFEQDRTTFRRCDVSESEQLAQKLSMRQRMAALLRQGPLEAEELAEEIGKDLDTIKRTVRRYKNQFTVIPGGKVALLA